MEIGMAEYANIIVDIYQGKLEKTVSYTHLDVYKRQKDSATEIYRPVYAG